MKTSDTKPDTHSKDIPRRALILALVAVVARLGVALTICALLVVALLNAIAEAIVYTLAAILALFFSTCAASGVASSGVRAHASAPTSEVATVASARQ